MESELDYWSAKALLEWQVELGATEAMMDAPINRYELQDQKPKAARGAEAPPAPVKPKSVDPVAEAANSPNPLMHYQACGPLLRLSNIATSNAGRAIWCFQMVRPVRV